MHYDFNSHWRSNYAQHIVLIFTGTPYGGGCGLDNELIKSAAFPGVHYNYLYGIGEV